MRGAAGASWHRALADFLGVLLDGSGMARRHRVAINHDGRVVGVAPGEILGDALPDLGEGLDDIELDLGPIGSDAGAVELQASEAGALPGGRHGIAPLGGVDDFLDVTESVGPRGETLAGDGAGIGGTGLRVESAAGKIIQIESRVAGARATGAGSAVSGTPIGATAAARLLSVLGGLLALAATLSLALPALTLLTLSLSLALSLPLPAALTLGLLVLGGLLATTLSLTLLALTLPLALTLTATLSLLILSGLLALTLTLSLALALALRLLVLSSLLVLTLALALLALALAPALGGLVGRLVDGAIEFIVREAEGLGIVAQHAGRGLFDAIAQIVDARLGTAPGLGGRGAIAGPQHLAGEV